MTRELPVVFIGLGVFLLVIAVVGAVPTGTTSGGGRAVFGALGVIILLTGILGLWDRDESV